jgi:hypothetical protein
LFLFEPNWASPITETLEWLTDVQTAHDGTELRAKLRLAPRRSFAFAVTLKTHEAQRFDAFLHRHQMEPVFMPVWTDGYVFTSAGTSDTGFFESMPVPQASLLDYRVGGSFIVLHGDGTHSTRVITSVGDTSVVFTSGGAVSFAPGDRIYPLRLVELSDSVEVARITAGLIQAEVVARCVDDTSLASTSWPTKYLDVEVFDWQPNRVSPVAASISRLSVVLDQAIGSWRKFDRASRPFVSRANEFIVRGREDIAQLRTWLHRTEGRVGYFWAPNWQADLTIVEDIGASDTTIDVRRVDYDDSYGGLASREHIMIRTVSGTHYRRVRSSAIIDATTERLTIDRPLFRNYARVEVLQVCWVDLSRIATDDVAFSWLSADVIGVQLGVRQTTDEADTVVYDAPGFLYGYEAGEDPVVFSDGALVRTWSERFNARNMVSIILPTRASYVVNGINGRPGISYPRVADQQHSGGNDNPFGGSTGLTIYAVISHSQVTAAGSLVSFWNSSSSANRIFSFRVNTSGTLNVRLYNTSLRSYTSTFAVASNTPTVVAMRFAGNTLHLRANSNTGTSSAFAAGGLRTGTTLTGVFSIGAESNTSSDTVAPFRGTIGCVYVYLNAHTNQQMDGIVSSLAARYGITL